VPGASQAGAWPTKHSLLTTNYEPKSPSRLNPTKQSSLFENALNDREGCGVRRTDSSSLSSAEKDVLIATLLARINKLSKRLTALEAEHVALRAKLNRLT